MNCLSLCVLLAVAIAHVNAGGYVLKGGVVDFGKPLDYFDQAVQAGKFAWSKKLEDELTSEQVDAERNVRQAAYVPTFFTSQENHAALQASRNQLPQQFRTVRESYYQPQEQQQQPLYYDTYPTTR